MPDQAAPGPYYSPPGPQQHPRRPPPPPQWPHQAPGQYQPPRGPPQPPMRPHQQHPGAHQPSSSSYQYASSQPYTSSQTDFDDAEGNYGNQGTKDYANQGTKDASRGGRKFEGENKVLMRRLRGIFLSKYKGPLQVPDFRSYEERAQFLGPPWSVQALKAEMDKMDKERKEHDHRTGQEWGKGNAS
ncbi:hypothetical protein EJ08DRAFT_129560 [Tothia fuscella]|uniref:Uncharacterized protein n=1 Tax=Tothia fuscella TaxID=1048955 RepID=A0A9P4NU80_9PEZI|nr:hypothetical protein EJ08DRAFT_129560 [Tothia fuscella]